MHVASSPDGQYLGVGFQDGDLIVWSPAENRVTARTTFGKRVFRIGWSRDNAVLFIATGGVLQMRSADGSSVLHTITTDHVELPCYALHPTQPIVATCGTKGGVRLWDVPSGKHVRDVLTQHPNATALAMNETAIVAGYSLGWFESCSHTGEPLGRGAIFDGYVASIAAAPDGTSFVAGGGKGRMLELKIGVDQSFPGTAWPRPAKPIATNWIDFAPDGSFVTACSDDTANVYRDTKDPLGTSLGHAFHYERKPWSREYIVSSAVFLPTKARLIATSHFSDCVKLWSGTELAKNIWSYRVEATLRFVDDRVVWADGDPIERWATLSTK